MFLPSLCTLVCVLFISCYSGPLSCILGCNNSQWYLFEMYGPTLLATIFHSRHDHHRYLQTWAYQGIAQVIFNHVYSCHEDQMQKLGILESVFWKAYFVHYTNSVQNTLSKIAHQMWRSQVLPRYPHGSAGAYDDH